LLFRSLDFGGIQLSVVSDFKPRARKSKPKGPPNVSRAGLEAAALRYLERFDCSVGRLRKVLGERVRRAQRFGADGAAAAPAIIEEILERYQASGLVDDQRFAKNFAERQRERGASRRMIEMKLRTRGITQEMIDSLLPRTESRGADLEAAQAFAKRRRLGPHRSPELRALNQRKDLAALARAGFDFETALRVIGRSSTDEDL
jgi:regulatory protein